MLDKSIPWHSFIMSLSPDALTGEITLPQGFSLRPYRDKKDELSWARIETAVGEFDSVEEAVLCHKGYLDHLEELQKRQWFAVDGNDNAVATCTVWWTGENKIPCIHALSCLPEMQGKGLGKAVALQAIKSAAEREPKTIWLETQSWSWKAICLYLKIGFVPRKTAVFNDTPNEFSETLPLISEKIGEKLTRQIENTAID